MPVLAVAFVPVMTPDELQVTAYLLAGLVGLILVVYGLQRMGEWLLRKLFPPYRD